METDKEKLITVAIHTYEKAVILKTLLENEGVETVIHNVNLIQPVVSSGVRVRIHERDLPLALKIIESSNLSDVSAAESAIVRSQVLVPIDFSEYSMKACKVAFALAKAMMADVTLFHSYYEHDDYSRLLSLGGDNYDESEEMSIAEAKQRAMQSMRYFREKIGEMVDKGELPRLNVQEVVIEGTPEEQILDYARDEKVSLIVIGTRGGGHKDCQYLGSVAAEVMDAGVCPVFSVPEDYDFVDASAMKRVLLFTNLKQGDLISFDTFYRIFRSQDLVVTIVPMVEHYEQESVDALVEYCTANYPNFKFITRKLPMDDFAHEVDDFVKWESIDCVVVPNKRKNMFVRLFSPSIAHKLLLRSDVPMLIIPVK